jgi:hypothetical protein
MSQLGIEKFSPGFQPLFLFSTTFQFLMMSIIAILAFKANAQLNCVTSWRVFLRSKKRDSLRSQIAVAC